MREKDCLEHFNGTSIPFSYVCKNKETDQLQFQWSNNHFADWKQRHPVVVPTYEDNYPPLLQQATGAIAQASTSSVTAGSLVPLVSAVAAGGAVKPKPPRQQAKPTVGAGASTALSGGLQLVNKV